LIYSDSEISTESDYDPQSETLAERLLALRDIVPPSTRNWVSSRVGFGFRLVTTAARFGSTFAWIVCTSALFVGVPWALCWAEEQNIIAMEQEYKMREMGGELLTAGTGQEPDTAERVSAALGKSDAKPSL
jgi:mitochondrial import receptor subunit TOM22